MPKFRTRQAPSPTGYLHIGTARQFLFTKLLADAEQGAWYLRIEDTDRARLVVDAVTKMLESLNTLGLMPSEGVTLTETGTRDSFYNVYQTGRFGPYIQSERLSLYHQHAQQVIDRKLAYWSFVTEEEKQNLLLLKQASHKAINYFEFATSKTSPEQMYMSLQEGLNHPDKPSLRYHIQRAGEVICEDVLLGTTTFDLALEEDFVIIKQDGYPTYHFAHLIDDHLMETSHVIRSQEWYPSLPKHVTMFVDYWGEAPAYVHVPFILGETGNKKLSKRDTNVDIQYYFGLGLLPEAPVNYLAFLGWNPGTEQELFLTPQEVLDTNPATRLPLLFANLSAQFNFDTLSKSPSRFNLEKLYWFNREYIRMISLPEYIERAHDFNKVILDYHTLEDWQFASYLLDKNRASTLQSLGSDSDCVITYERPQDSELTWKKLTTQEAKICLKDIWEQVIEPLYNSTEAESLFADQAAFWGQSRRVADPTILSEQFLKLAKTFELIIKDWLTSYDKDTGSYLWPLRVALSGKAKSPSPFELLAILPKSEIEKRIKSILYEQLESVE